MKILLKLLLLPAVSFSVAKSECYQHQENHFLCPIDYTTVGGFEIEITSSKDIFVNCNKLSKFNISLIPKFTSTDIELVKFTSCPLPENGFEALELGNWTIPHVIVKFEHGNSINLSKNHLRGLESVKYLQFRNYIFKSLDEDALTNTPNLRILELYQSRLSQLEVGVFEKTPDLEFLDLADNKLKELPTGLFKPLKKLEFLRLWDNRLHTLNESSFEPLANLKTLLLDGNKINKIDEDTFKHLLNLEDLSLASNQLRFIPSGLFRSCTKLQSVELHDNLNLLLTDYLFANLPVLQTVDLSNCGLRHIPEHIFENSADIKFLRLRENRLNRVPDGLFKNLTLLEEVDLGSNSIYKIEKIFLSNSKLKRLLLQDNSIEEISGKTFSGLLALEELNLQQNQIVSIDASAFFHNEHLKIVNLSRNFYSEQEEARGLFEDVVNLEMLDLSHNSIHRVENVITFDNKWSLEKVDLSHNLIEAISLASLNPVSDVEIFLGNNKISSVNFDDVHFLNGSYVSSIYLNTNFLRCDCQNFELAKYFHGQAPSNVRKLFNIRGEIICGYPEQLQSKPVVEVPLSEFTCPLDEDAECSEKCQCRWRPLDQSVVIDCANQNLTLFPKIGSYSRIELNLANNSLEIMDPGGYDNVTKLFLSSNKLKTVSRVPPKLEVLHLDHNELTSLNFTVLQALNSSNITLSYNPWICDCASQNLTAFIRHHSKQLDWKDIYCINTTTRLIYLDQNDLCHDWTLIYIILTLSVLLVLAISTTTAYYRYKREIKIWLFSKNLCLLWVSEDDLDHDKDYDAFISYSHFDENFVCELVSELENGPKPFKLCLHYRNWVPGELINVQIINSVASSRRTVIVLSNNYVKSVWGKAEFQQAHAEAMSEGRARVIVILYGEVDVEKLDEELRAYLRTNTYLKWGDPYFWKKLRYALPHRTVNG